MFHQKTATLSKMMWNMKCEKGAQWNVPDIFYTFFTFSYFVVISRGSMISVQLAWVLNTRTETKQRLWYENHSFFLTKVSTPLRKTTSSRNLATHLKLTTDNRMHNAIFIEICFVTFYLCRGTRLTFCRILVIFVHSSILVVNIFTSIILTLYKALYDDCDESQKRIIHLTPLKWILRL